MNEWMKQLQRWMGMDGGTTESSNMAPSSTPITPEPPPTQLLPYRSEEPPNRVMEVPPQEAAQQPRIAVEPPPNAVHWSGDLRLVGGHPQPLPEALVIHGNLFISGSHLERLPDFLKVDGSVQVTGRPRIRNLPTQLAVGRDLLLDHVLVERWEGTVRVGRHLRIRKAPHLLCLPSLAVRGALEIRDAPKLTSLPDSLQVGDALLLRRCTALRVLPPNLHLAKGLDLSGCTALETVGCGTVVGPLDETRVNKFQARINLTGCTSLKALPQDLKTAGPIEVAGSGLQGLPSTLVNVPVLFNQMQVTHRAAFASQDISAQEILQVSNAELRRLLLEKRGKRNMLEEARAETLDADRDAGGERRLLQVCALIRDGRGERTLIQRFLECRCPSTQRVYLLEVPSTTPSCRHAAAWIAGFDAVDDYRPLVET